MIFLKLIRERWGLAGGCEDCGLVDSGRTQLERETGLKREPWGSGGLRFLSLETLRGKMSEWKSRTWYWACSWCSLCMCTSSGPRAGAECWKKLAGFMSTRLLLIF